MFKKSAVDLNSNTNSLRPPTLICNTFIEGHPNFLQNIFLCCWNDSLPFLSPLILLHSSLDQQLLINGKHRCVVPIHGHLYRKLKREVSRTEKWLKIATTSMFSHRRRRSRARKEWICERRCQVSVSGVVYMCLRDCVAL